MKDILRRFSAENFPFQTHARRRSRRGCPSRRSNCLVPKGAALIPLPRPEDLDIPPPTCAR